MDSDEVAARHYHQFELARVRTVAAHAPPPVYVSYRKGSSIYWTRRPIQLSEGETLLTDGAQFARARCGNRISTTPQQPVAETEVPADVLDIPESWQEKLGPPVILPPLPGFSGESTGGPGSVQPTTLPPFPVVVVPPVLGPVGGGGSGGGGTGGTSGGGGYAGGSGGSGGGPSGGPGSGGNGSGNSGASSGGTGGASGGNSGASGSGGTDVTGGGNSGGSGPSVPGGSGGGSSGGSGSGGSGGAGGSIDTGTPPPGTGGTGLTGTSGDIPQPQIAPVPEPGSVVLLLTAVAALAGHRWWLHRSKSR